MEFVIAAASPASTTIGRKRRRLVVRTATRAQFTALICTRRPPIYFVRFRRTRSHRAVYIQGGPKKSKPPPIFQKIVLKDCQRD